VVIATAFLINAGTVMPTEPIQDIAHIGTVELLTPSADRSLWFFRDVLGMEAVHTAGDSVYLRGYGDYATSTLKITSAPNAGVGTIAWRCVSTPALDRRAASIEAAGLGAGWNNGDFGRGRSYRFRDPEGHAMEIYFEEQKFVAPPTLHSALKNQPQKYAGRGVGVRRIDHLALLARDVSANRKFAEEQLGFCLREQVIFDGGKTEIGSWLSPTATHHEVAYIKDLKGGTARLHHFSLWVDNREDVLRAADILSENDIFIEVGPSKHNNSQGFSLYCREPGGNRIEIYSGSFLVFAPDWEVVTWDEKERGSGMYWGAALPDSFLKYATPDIEKPVEGEAPKLPVFF
jgi:catechol 2,3-dioxygenase